MKIRLDPLDILFSEFIRRRAMRRVHGCERCLVEKTDYKELQCSHFWGRSRRSVRYDEDNGIGLCGACHLYLSSHPAEYTEWFRQHLGERAFDLLNSRIRITYPKPDKKLLTLYFKAMIGKEIRNELLPVV